MSRGKARSILFFRWNKVLDTNLDADRLQNLYWCTCSSAENGRNCSIDHKFPKLCFCCKEASSSISRYALAYREKIGNNDCIIVADGFYRRTLSNIPFFYQIQPLFQQNKTITNINNNNNSKTRIR